MKVALNSFRDAPEAGLTLALIVGGWVTIAAESLSSLSALTPFAARIFWSVSALLLGGIALGRGLRRPRMPALSWPLGLTLALGLMTLVTALLAPPNTCDSLAYHLARVAQWMQNQSLAPYPAGDGRQIFLQPWAEYAILQLTLLAGDDRWANLVQWAAACLCCLGVSGIARELGATPRAQTYAAALCASLPMLLLQASSTQNDCVEALWMVCLVYFCLRLRSEFGWREWGLASLAAGLAWLTKGTGYIYSAPFLAVLFWKWRSPVRLVSFLGLALLLNAGFLLRNVEACGRPLALHSEALSAPRNAGLTPLLWACNLARHLSVHLPVPNGDKNFDRLARGLHHLVGVEPEDPRFTFVGIHFGLSGWRRHEDLIGNWLTLLLLPGCLWLRRHRTYASQLLVTFCLLAAGLCWNPWLSRVQLPLFVLLTPLLGEWLALPRRRPWPQALLLAHLLWGFVCVLWNENRPWIDDRILRSDGTPWNIFTRPREEQYFSSLPDLEEKVYRDLGPLLRQMDASVIGVLGGRLDYLLYVQTHFRTRFIYDDKRAPVVIRKWPHQGGALPGYRSVWREGLMEVYVRL